jgi:hypothetical protein
MSWVKVREGRYRWTPADGITYECDCIGAAPRSKRFFARVNGVTIGSPKVRVFQGSIEKCKELCERHRQVNYTGGEVS